jgi:opacity protein-like surface antigen
MKKFTINALLSFCLIILMIGSTGNVNGQGRRIELTPFGGYLLGGSLKFSEGKIKIEDAASYGGNFAVEIGKGQFVEFNYTRMDSKAAWRPYNNYLVQYPDTTLDMAMNYLQIGSVNELHLDNDAIRPYGTFTLGTSWIHPKYGDYSDKWFFTFAVGAGLKYFFNDRIGIRIQARMIVPMLYNGTYFYIGYGSSSVTVTSTSPIVQGDFTGGLIIVLGN